MVTGLLNGSPYSIAYVLAYRGEVDRAFRVSWTRRRNTRDSGLADVAVEPLFDNPAPLTALAAPAAQARRDPDTLAKIEFKVTLPAAEGATASIGSDK